MPRRKKKLLDVKNRILLYLSTLPIPSEDCFDAPFSMTQAGIARHVGISRRNVPRGVNFLIEEKLVDFRKAHVPGLKQKRNIYFLTPQGFSRAAAINLRLSEVRITLKNPDGSEQIVSPKEVMDKFPELNSFIDVVRETEYGVLDPQKTHDTNLLPDKKFLDYSNSLFKPRFFFGREEEKKAIAKWYSDKLSTTLTISGIAGIGKTTLIADVVENLKEHHVICIKIHTWSTLRNVTSALSNFLSKLGRKDLGLYLKSVETPDISELHTILEKVVDVKMLVILDDCHNMNPEVRDFLEMLFEVSRVARNLKIIAIGRSVPSFYDRRAVMNGEVKEIALEGLDKESCRRLLEEIGARVEHLDRIYEETKGHPLFVELSNGQDIKKAGDIKKFLFEAYYSHLSKNERDVLEFASVVRYPVEYRMLAHRQEYMKTLLSKGVLRENADGRFELHDLMKDFLYRSQSPAGLHSKHSEIAEYYLEFDDPESILESIYHRVSAKEFDLASELIITHGKDIIRSGESVPLCSYIGKVLAQYSDISPEDRLQMLSLMAEGQATLGDWNNALLHNHEVISLAEMLDQKKAAGCAHLNIGMILQRRNELDEAEKHLLLASKIFRDIGEKKLNGKTEHQFGMIHSRRGEYEKATENFETCLSIAESIGDRHLMAMAYNAYGKLFMTRGEDEKACENLEKARVLLEDLGDFKELAKTIIGLGACSFEMMDIPKTIEYQTKAIEMTEITGDVRIRAYALSNLAPAYIEKPDLVAASECLDEAWEIFYRLGEKRMLASIYMNYAVVNNKRENWKEAINNFNDAIELLEEMCDSGGLAKARLKLGQLFSNMGENEKARKLLEEVHGYYEEIGEEKMKKMVAEKLKEL